jgi:hypothetical protein
MSPEKQSCQAYGIGIALNAGGTCATRNGVHKVSHLRATVKDGSVKLTCVSNRFHRELSPCLEVLADDLDVFCTQWIAMRKGESQATRRDNISTALTSALDALQTIAKEERLEVEGLGTH